MRTPGHGYHSRFSEWGAQGVRALAARCPVLVIVDVLSFGTAVDVAVGTGARVLPLPWQGDRAHTAATEAGAVLVAPRDLDRWSLSPSSLRSLRSDVLLALPSPNGASLSTQAGALGATVFAGCVRNATAVAKAAQATAAGAPVGVIAAGERWDDDSLRPAVEDLLGAGAILDALDGTPSPEAEVAVRGFTADRLPDLLADCVSGRELAARGFAHDVALAAQLDASSSVPLLHHGIFEAHR